MYASDLIGTHVEMRSLEVRNYILQCYIQEHAGTPLPIAVAMLIRTHFMWLSSVPQLFTS